MIPEGNPKYCVCRFPQVRSTHPAEWWTGAPHARTTPDAQPRCAQAPVRAHGPIILLIVVRPPLRQQRAHTYTYLRHMPPQAGAHIFSVHVGAPPGASDASPEDPEPLLQPIADARSWKITCACEGAVRAQGPCNRYRSHFGSRYKLGCCGHAGLFCVYSGRGLSATLR